MIKDTITSAPGITILRPIDNNFTAGSDTAAIGATVVYAGKGPVGRPFVVNAANWEQVCGRPLPISAGEHAEGLRHLADALEECQHCVVVRAMADDARFPSVSFPADGQLTPKDYKSKSSGAATADDDGSALTVKLGNGKPDHAVSEADAAIQSWSAEIDGGKKARVLSIDADGSMRLDGKGGIKADELPDQTEITVHGQVKGKAAPPVKEDHAYGDRVISPSGCWLSVWPVDGDPSLLRTVAITDVDTQKRRFTLEFSEIVDGEERPIEGERFTVGLNPDDTDDSGLSAYAVSVLEERSQRFRCSIATATTFEAVTSAKAYFSGGTNGSLPGTDEFIAGWDLLASDDVEFNLTFAAGNYDPAVIAHAAKIAYGKLAPLKLDAPPGINQKAAIKWMSDLNLDDYMAQCTHYPYKALDRWFGGKSVWGASGALVAAKARCFSTPTGHAAVKGAHLAPAGEKRGRVSRRSIEPIHTTGTVPPEALVKARINPVSKGVFFNDCLTTWSKENYLRFEHVVAILVDIEAEFLEAASAAKFEPDGLTRDLLTDIATQICSKREEAGAFVRPRDPAKDGDQAYAINVEQVAIDLWRVEVSFAPTGVARRIALQPRLIR